MRQHEAAETKLSAANAHSIGNGWAVQLVDVVEASGPRPEHASVQEGPRESLVRHMLHVDETSRRANGSADDDEMADELL